MGTAPQRPAFVAFLGFAFQLGRRNAERNAVVKAEVRNDSRPVSSLARFPGPDRSHARNGLCPMEPIQFFLRPDRFQTKVATPAVKAHVKSLVANTFTSSSSASISKMTSTTKTITRTATNIFVLSPTFILCS